MKNILQVNGRKMTFTKHGIIAIVEEHLTGKTTKQVSTAKVAQVPTEDRLFEVNPRAIDQSLFQKKRKDAWQEKRRKLILEAFGEVKSSPEKYEAPFYTLIPKKNWNGYKTVTELKEYANDLGGFMADWAEQALEWAQRISNGESWIAVCNNADTANWYRMIVWKNGYARLVGGSRNYNDISPASEVSNYDFGSNDEPYRFYGVVPLVCLRKSNTVH